MSEAFNAFQRECRYKEGYSCFYEEWEICSEETCPLYEITIRRETMICPVCKIKIDKECWRCGWQAGRCPYCAHPIVIEGKCIACGKRILYLPSPHK